MLEDSETYDKPFLKGYEILVLKFSRVAFISVFPDLGALVIPRI